MPKLLIAAFAAALIAVPAFAADQPANPPATDATKPEAAASDKKPDAEKLICRRESDTGTRVAIRTCKTQAQIDAEREAARRTLRRNENLTTKLTPPTPGR
ncbi:hypothetical protein BH11PSE2_BH11PSE2_16140 [soil metagenome]